MPLFESSQLLVSFLLCQTHLNNLSLTSQLPKKELKETVQYCTPLLDKPVGKYLVEDLVELAFLTKNRNLVEKLSQFAERYKNQLPKRAYFELLALKSFLNGNIKDAYEYGKRALELGSTNLRLLIFLAVSSESFGDVDTFLKVVQKLHEMERNIEPLTDRFFYDQPFPPNEKTFKVAKELLKLRPKEGYFVTLALTLEGAKKFSDEGKVIKEGLKRFPNSIYLKKLLIHYYVLIGQVKEAEHFARKEGLERYFYFEAVKNAFDFATIKDISKKILSRYPTDTGILMYLLAKFATFDYLEGLELLEREFIKHHIEDPSLWGTLLLAKFEAGGKFSPKEEKVIDRLYRDYPQEPVSKVLKALELAVSKNPEGAKKIISDLNPSSLYDYLKPFYYALATDLFGNNYGKNLREDYLLHIYLKVLYHLDRQAYIKTAKELIEEETSPQRCLFLSNPAWELGDLKTVLGLSELCLQKFPKNSNVLNSVGYLMLLIDPQRYLKKAKQLLEEALKVDPQNVDAFDSLGWAYYFEGNYKEAFKWVKKALEREPDSVVANYHMAKILLKLNRPCEAEKYLNKAFEGMEKLPSEPEPGIYLKMEKLQNELRTLCGSD